MKDPKYFFIIILLSVTMFFSWGFYFYAYPQQDTVNINIFPLRIGQWVGQDLPIEKVDRIVLETKNVFMRRYTNFEARDIYLYIAYSQTNSKATNPPEVFYRDSGISILDKGKDLIIINSSQFSIKANWLLLDNDQNQQLAYYWFKVGGIYTQSYWKQQAICAFNNLIGAKTGSALIRISADIIDGHEAEAKNLISAFASKLGPQLSQYLP